MSIRAPSTAPILDLDVDRTNRFLGTELSAAEIGAVLRRIELGVEVVDNQRLRVSAPSFRPDLTRAVDLAEEVARLVGYDRVPVTSPEAFHRGGAGRSSSQSAAGDQDCPPGRGIF